MSTKKTVTKFFKETFARITGDDATVLILKNEKRANKAFKSQIIQNENLLDALEDALETAEENYATAKFPTDPIKEGEVYVQNVLNARKKVKEAKAELQKVLDSIQTYKDILAELAEEVEA